MFRILIADDHDIARRGVRALLENHPGWQVCGEAKDGRETVEMVAATKPDLILLDIGMPNLNGLEATRQILATAPDSLILILTMHDTDQMVREVLRAGARGFLFKSDAGSDLVAAVEALQQRRTFFTTRVSQLVLNGFLDREQLGDGSTGQQSRSLDAARARGDPTARRRQDQQGSCRCPKSQRQDCRDASHQPDAQARSALRGRSHPLRGPQRNCPGLLNDVF